MFATVDDDAVAGVATRSAPTRRCPTCPIPRGREGLSFARIRSIQDGGDVAHDLHGE
jgi:hypothetical protein